MHADSCSLLIRSPVCPKNVLSFACCSHVMLAQLKRQHVCRAPRGNILVPTSCSRPCSLFLDFGCAWGLLVLSLAVAQFTMKSMCVFSSYEKLSPRAVVVLIPVIVSCWRIALRRILIVQRDLASLSERQPEDCGTSGADVAHGISAACLCAKALG